MWLVISLNIGLSTKNERSESQLGLQKMPQTNRDQQIPRELSPYQLSLKLISKRSNKLHKYVTQNVLISEIISITT